MPRTRSSFAFLVFSLMVNLACAQAPQLSHKDFKPLVGAWKGSLTYLDYSSKQPYTMPADVSISRIGKSSQYIFANSYPDEPQANDADTVTISSNGRSLDGEIIMTKRKLPSGILEVITEIQGQDGNDNAAATLRHTYSISKAVFSIQKHVKFEGQTEWILRHTYRWERD